jgi:hypothetical protein
MNRIDVFALHRLPPLGGAVVPLDKEYYSPTKGAVAPTGAGR